MSFTSTIPTPSTARRPAIRHGIAAMLALLALLLASVLFAAMFAAPAAAVDTFYLRLFEDGRSLAASGEPRAAADKLRLACFGMLDEPPVLAPCIGQLLLAEEAAGAPQDALESLVDRLLEVEQRFRGWSEPAAGFRPNAELRRRVDRLVESYATAETLARTPGFDGAALRKQAERVAALPPADRRKELNLLVQRQSDAVIWHVLSAELYLEEGEETAAVRAVGEILRVFAGGDQGQDLDAARCVRGQARASLGECGAEVIAELELCPAERPGRQDVDAALAVCLAEAGRWQEVKDALERLPQERRESRDMRRLERRAREVLGEPAAAAGAGDGGSGAAGDQVAEEVPREPIFAPPPGVVPVSLAVATPGSPSSADDDKPLDGMERVRRALEVEQRELYSELWPEVRKAARKRRAVTEDTRLAGDLAFRLSRWRDAVRFFADDESLGRERPDLQLELSIALYYEGRLDEAREAFEVARPFLSSSAWTGFWDRELGAGS